MGGKIPITDELIAASGKFAFAYSKAVTHQYYEMTQEFIDALDDLVDARVNIRLSELEKDNQK